MATEPGDSAPVEVVRRWSLRYGQCWEDADRLLEPLQPLAGRTVLSIASGGDNSLALLAEGPARLIVLDHNPAQIALLELKLAAITCLAHPELMELLGAWPPEQRSPKLPPAERIQHRLELYRRCRPLLSPSAAAFWDERPALIGGGLLRAGRFERYLESFRRWLLPLVRGPGAWRPLLEGLGPQERAAWYARRWDGRRWRLLFHLFFSRRALGHLGTDPSQVRYGRGSQAALLLERLRHVLVELDPRDNPYLHWLLQGSFPRPGPLPRALQPPQVARIRHNRHRLTLHPLSLATYLAQEEPAAGWIERFNLSNVFEYQSEEATTELLAGLHRIAAPGALLVGWNRLADRDGRLAPPHTWRFDGLWAEQLHRHDRVFFYRRMVVAEAQPAEPAGPFALRRIDPSPGLWPADECWQLEAGGRPLARASLWWRHTPPLPGERVGAIGELSGGDAAAARALLQHACRRLAEQGCTRVLAPMDGNTWNAYRCRTGAPLAFPGEPAPGPEWIAHLHACGFQVAAHSLCGLCDNLERRRPVRRRGSRLEAVQLTSLAELQRQGPLSEALPGAIHRLVHTGFANQPYFLPLGEAQFLAWLQGPVGQADPACTLLAWADDQLVGLLLAQRSNPTLVVRTLVVQPGRAWAGLGNRLLEEAHHRARARGYRSALHVLMQASGASQALSAHHGVACGGYVLLERRLGEAPPQDSTALSF
jgi:S-adenosylmethionine-diacylglycerol 3-amino-3-carboxypropyl transferase